MNNLLEKFKSLDKRVQIGIGIGAAVIIIVIMALMVGLNNKPANSDGTQNGTETEGQLGTEVFGTEELGTENINATEMETELGTEIDSTENEVVDGQLPSDTTDSSEEEILGGGTADDPYLETPNANNMTVTTVEIPAGKTVHYGIYRVSGMYLTINDPNAYVIYDGTTYKASNGKVSFKVVSDALASDAVHFEIGNNGSSAASFTLKFSNPTGTQMNPTKVDNITKSGNDFKVSLEVGNDTGHYYKYKAQNAGTIKFYISSFSSKTTGAEGVLSVTNNKTAQQKTFEEEDVQVDENGNKYILMDVTAGDELIIIVSTKSSGRVKYPAADITWIAQYQ